ncbi:hypothetical protein [Amycolatopsis eburnea]|uniref:hypothetical protein n=1 Tax=Amycolatopsis eburnea TaxID=2267691 RepID=UPI00177F1B9A|nr:hypothetical protein [Amycolatopsis eburnea]
MVAIWNGRSSSVIGSSPDHAGSPRSRSIIFVGELVLGAGLGAFFAVELALIADVLPSAETAGKDLGVANLAQSPSQSLIPVAAPALIASFGYLGLFLGGAVFGVLGAISVTRVQKVR